MIQLTTAISTRLVLHAPLSSLLLTPSLRRTPLRYRQRTVPIELTAADQSLGPRDYRLLGSVCLVRQDAPQTTNKRPQRDDRRTADADVDLDQAVDGAGDLVPGRVERGSRGVKRVEAYGGDDAGSGNTKVVNVSDWEVDTVARVCAGADALDWG